jgi:CSLREA domain-containing protein
VRSGHSCNGGAWPVARLAALVSVLLCLALPGLARGATLTVTTTADGSGLCTPGLCTLREAIEASNSLLGHDVIAFNLPGAAPYAITWSSDLPLITDPVTIDGTTQPGYAGTPVVKLGPTTLRGLDMQIGGNLLLALDIRDPGLHITGGGNTIGQPGKGNVFITQQLGYSSISIHGDTNAIQSNQIASVYGAVLITGSDTTVGGTAANTGNAISSGRDSAIHFTGDGNTAEGNSVTGPVRIDGSGNTVGGSTSGASNLLTDGGITIVGDQNEARGNSISAVAGALGVNVSGNSNQVLANTIDLPAGPGVRVGSGTGNEILSNIIPTGVGIRLGNGTTNDPGDVDTGPNDLQNYPVLSQVRSGGPTTAVVGTLSSEPNKTYNLEFFSAAFTNPQTHCSGPASTSDQGGAERVLGSQSVTTDAGGNASFTATLPTTTPVGDWVTATATDPDGNTSEFALCIRDVINFAGYARPISATPITIRFLPAFVPCTSANEAHGAPLSSPSCNPPMQSSNYLTVGTPDVPGNGFRANSNGSLVLTVVGEKPINPNNGDQANIDMTFKYSDVRRKSDLLDYAGELRAILTLRITDRHNGSGLNVPATTADIPFGITVPCSTTPADATIGSNCNLMTTADAVTANSIVEGKRSVLELGQIKVFDGGADGDADTAGDNTLFAVQGTYAP